MLSMGNMLPQGNVHESQKKLFVKECNIILSYLPNLGLKNIEYRA